MGAFALNTAPEREACLPHSTAWNRSCDHILGIPPISDFPIDKDTKSSTLVWTFQDTPCSVA
jgi:hypothetical protein